METVEHQCRRGRKCVARHRGKDNEWVPAGTDKPFTLCPPCEEQAFENIEELHIDWRRLWVAFMEQRTAAPAQKVKGTAENSIPIPLGIDTVMSAIEDVTHRWARIVTQGGEIPWNREDAVRHCVSVLRAHKGTLIDLPSRGVWVNRPHPMGGDDLHEKAMDGVDAVMELSHLHTMSNAVLQLGEVKSWLPDPCPHCGKRTLTPSKDQEHVSCKSCYITWDRAHFALLWDVLDFDRQTVKA